jgi:hypothetical protein
MAVLKVHHSTVYRYRERVGLGQHHVMFRPGTKSLSKNSQGMGDFERRYRVGGMSTTSEKDGLCRLDG